MIALFPEGASHDQPKLLELKTGAARIALGVAVEEELQIVPAGLYYTWKTRFRSSALLTFGEPITVAPVALDERGEPPLAATKDLTHRIEDALSRLTLGAESREALDLVRRAEGIFSIETADEPVPLLEQLDLRRRFVAGSVLLQQRDPAVILTPLSGYAALLARESLDLLIGRARALLYALSGAYAARRLVAERNSIREEIIAVATELGMSG